MSEYFLALEHQPLFVIPFEKVVMYFSYSQGEMIGKDPYRLETIDAFTRRFSNSKHLYDFLKGLGIIPEDIHEGRFLLVQTSKSLHISTMEVCYFGMEDLFCVETLIKILEDLYDTTYINYLVGWEIKNPSLMRLKNEITKEEFINTCKKYLEVSEGQANYIKLRKLAMIAARCQQEGNPNVTKTEKLVYQKPYWADVE